MTSSTELEPARTSDLAIGAHQTRFTDVQVAALRHLGLQGDDADNEALQFSDADLGVFFHQCQRTGLDPFARQIYMIMRKEFGRPKPTIQTGIDGFRKIGKDAARRHGVKASRKATVWLDDDGNEFKTWNRAQPPAAAMVNIQVDGVEDNEAVVNFREYVQLKRNGEPNSMWSKMPANQLGKCAEAAAWRMAFPSDFSGIVGADEPVRNIVDEDGQPAGGPTPRAQATGRGVAGLDQHLGKGKANDDTTADGPVSPGGGISKTQFEAIVAGLNKLFAGGVEGRQGYVQSAVGRPVTGLDQLTADEANELLTVIAEHTAERAATDNEQETATPDGDSNFK